jgi:cation diffusion facilitator CzcD-associated flavoprotein CzcO
MNAECSIPQSTDVIIIGSGFAGLGMAVRLRRQGTHDFVVLERADDVGGTWRDNEYPGAACDIQSHLYSYSFRPNPRWSRVYAPQREILDYLRDTAREENILPHVRFDANVLKATWDDEEGLWNVVTSNGTYCGRVLISAAGHLSDPSYPSIEGLEDFEGQIFHSARWPRGWDSTGKRIGVIGTGASAIQIVPELARSASHLTVFQRTPPYVIPRRDHVYSEAEKRMFERFPETAQKLRDELFWNNENRFPQRRGVPAFINDITAIARRHLEQEVADPDLRAKLTPDYAIGCKRVLISNDYYASLIQPHVTLETAGVARAVADGLVLGDGQTVALDALVVATGFETSDLPIAEVVSGRGGERLADRWREGGQAYACCSVAGFPNFFLMLGPNTGLGAGSMVFMIETQVKYIGEAIKYVLETASVIEPDRHAEQAYVDTIYRRSEGTVWLTGGCRSWYIHQGSGRFATLWPDFMMQFRAENGTFSTDSYIASSFKDASADLIAGGVVS